MHSPLFMNTLKNHKGRFVTLKVKRARGGVSVYNAKIQKINPESVRFFSVNENRVRTVLLKNLV